MRQFIRDNALGWLENFHLDGLRYDMTPYMRSVDAGEMNIPEGWSLCHWINTEVRTKYPRKILIAEDLHSNPAVSDLARAARHSTPSGTPSSSIRCGRR